MYDPSIERLAELPLERLEAGLRVSWDTIRSEVEWSEKLRKAIDLKKSQHE